MIEIDDQGRLVITLTDGTVLDPIELPKDEHTHVYEHWYCMIAPTCTEEGLEISFCEECGSYKSRSIPKNDEHSYSASVTAPTCIERGKIIYTCACGSSYVEYYGATVPHADCPTCTHSLEGKSISFLGDSITTYPNWSNNTSYNSTIGSNAVWYDSSKMNSVHFTYWMKTVEELGLSLCVNNSWSGSFVTTRAGETSAGCMRRAANLHNDHTGEIPDIIVVYLGTNDVNNGTPLGEFSELSDIYSAEQQAYVGDLTSFAPAYATMIHKIKNNYPSADIYLCTVDAYSFNSGREPSAFNEVISYVADYFDCTLVDFYGSTDISRQTIGNYTVDSYLHPNVSGMNQMYECIREALAENYKLPEKTEESVFDTSFIPRIDISSTLSCAKAEAPWMYLDDVNQRIAGRTVTRIGIPIKSVSNYASECFFTVYVINMDTLEISKSIRVTLPANRFSSNTVNQWVYFDVDITLEDDETLAFIHTSDTIDIGYSSTVSQVGGVFRVSDQKQFTHISILFDVVVKNV